MQKFPAITILVGGLLVLTSYFIVFSKAGPYFKSPYWLGIPSNVVYMLTAFQILAAVAFLTLFTNWIFFAAPKTGLFAKHNAMGAALVVFFVGAVAWPWALKLNIPWLVVTSLILTAIASILFVAAAFEENYAKWHTILCALVLAFVVVLVDGIGWNARYILQEINS